MLKFFSRLGGQKRPEIIDAGLVYQKIMQQSRNPVFYQPGLVSDNTDGRMEVLCFHLALVLKALRSHGDNGAKLSQAVYDVMVEDFDVALREEGLSDTGVKRRIKPLAKMFFARAKTYSDALANNESAFTQVVSQHISRENGEKFAGYGQEFVGNLATLSLGKIAKAEFSFPEFL